MPKVSKKGLPESMKAAFKRKPYDIYAIRRYLRKDVSYQGYDVYTVGDRPRKFVRGRVLITLVKQKHRRR